MEMTLTDNNDIDVFGLMIWQTKVMINASL